jgi:Mg-chelatase subunit ChlI
MSIAVERQVSIFQDNFRLVRDEVSRVIVGNRDNIVGIMTCLLARGHVLLEGIPGIGKTKLVQTLADVLHLKFSRIQFTPDPSSQTWCWLTRSTVPPRRPSRRCSRRCRRIASLQAVRRMRCSSPFSCSPP